MTEHDNCPALDINKIEGFILDKPLLLRAKTLAEKAHEGQKRAEGLPYFTHCLEVARIIFEE